LSIRPRRGTTRCGSGCESDQGAKKRGELDDERGGHRDFPSHEMDGDRPGVLHAENRDKHEKQNY
jgi:hypothetical protein